MSTDPHDPRAHEPRRGSPDRAAAAGRREPAGSTGAGPEPEAGEDLLASFQAGDAQAFDALVAAYEPRLVKFFYRLCWDLGRAEDLTQNLFLKLLRSVDRYRPEGRLSTYVFRVATNLWIDQYRADRPRRRLFSLDQALLTGAEAVSGPIDAPSPPLAVELDEEKRRLRDALEHLTAPHRIVFELAVYQELPYSEVSRIVGIPIGTVKSRMHNSVKALREILLGHAEDSAEVRQEVRTHRQPFRSGGQA